MNTQISQLIFKMFFKSEKPITKFTLWIVYWAIFNIKYLHSCFSTCVPVWYLVSFVFVQNSLFTFTHQKTSQILREYIFIPLVSGIKSKNKLWYLSKYSFLKPHNFEIFQQNPINLKSAIKYHYSSTMAYRIGRPQKMVKQNKKRLDNTTANYTAPSIP